VNFLEARKHPAVFGPFFKGDTWQSWEAFAAAIFGLEMDAEALELYRRYTGRQGAPTGPFEEAVLVCGRRAGKSRILATMATYIGTFRDYKPYLAPGERATVSVLASDRRQARTIFRYIEGLLDQVPMLRKMVEEKTSDSLSLTNSVTFEITTASMRTTRGYTYAAALADEAAFWRDESSANPDEEILNAIRPGLGTIPGSILLIASSPYRKRGALWNAFAEHYGKDDAPVLVWKAGTRDMHPGFPQRIIDKAYADDPEAASAEYGGEFRNDLSDFIGRDIIRACTAAGQYEIAPARGTHPVAFVDPSGGSADSMTLAIAHRDGDRAILDAVREVKPPFSPEAVVTDFAALLKSYGITRVTGDRYAGEWPRERFRVHGIQYELADQPKSEIYLACVPLLNATRVQLLDLPRLASQFTSLERRTSRSGRDTVDHAPGAHDDLANAVAGALLLANSGKRKMTAEEVAVLQRNVRTVMAR
jgi:hypothetical protein